MFGFLRPKHIYHVAKNERIELSDSTTITFEEMLAEIAENARLIGVLNTAINRIERKQNRYIEIINEREATLTPEKLAQLASNPGGMPPGGNHGQLEVGSEESSYSEQL